MPLTPPQQLVASSSARFRVLVSGRRFGKTWLAVRELARFAAPVGRKVWYIAPTYRQAKQIAWEMLKEKLQRFRWVRKINEQELTVTVKSGSKISLKGADYYDSLRGVGLNFVVLDEFADIKKEAWTEVIRPTLSDTGGLALFCGTPKGRNWAYDLYLQGIEGVPEWASWQFTTLEGGNVPEEEIEAARRDLDELTFQQEYEASFVNFLGRAYYPFRVESHCVPLRDRYNPDGVLIFCFDFNVSPGVAVICQEMRLPNGEDGTGVIGEVFIPRNSNTPAVCRKILQDWGSHRGPVRIYGDATGGARGTAKVAGSDWDLVRQELRQMNPMFDVPPSNPPERARINAVNSRLKSGDGTIRLMVDPQAAPHVVRDLEGVRLLEGGSGEIDKKHDPELTHLSDALGYYIERVFPVTTRTVQTRKLVGI